MASFIDGILLDQNMPEASVTCPQIAATPLMELPYVGSRSQDVYPSGASVIDCDEIEPLPNRSWWAGDSIVAKECLRQEQEVHKEHLPLFREYRFWMKLHAKCWVETVCEPHDLAFVRTRRRGEMRRACLIELNNKRMVAPNAKWRRQLLE